jgi:hypothetical protein
MPFARNGKRYTLRAQRLCKQCHEITDQMAVSCQYSAPDVPKVPAVYLKRLEWICEWCENYEEEIKEVLVPTDKTMIVKRLLSIPDDYDVLGFTLSSEPNVISIKIRLPDFDMGELRAIQFKQEETGFITAEELMRLHRAGFNRPREVPQNLSPRTKAFSGKGRAKAVDV